MPGLKAKVDEFNSVTPIHGLGFAHHSETVIGTIVWVMVVMLGAALFCRDLYNILRLKDKEPTATAVNVIHNKSLYFEQMQICIDILNSQRDQDQKTNLNVENSTGAIENFGLFAGANGTMKYSLVNKSQPVDDLVILLLSGLTTLAETENCLETNGDQEQNHVDRFVEVFYLMKKYGTPLEEMAKFTAIALCKKISLSLHLFEIVGYGFFNPTDKDLCRPENFLSINEKQMCYQWLPALGFNSDKENEAGYAVSIGSSNTDKYIRPDGQLTLYGGSARDKSNSQSVSYGTKTSFKWKYDGVYSSYSRKREPCGSGSTECRERCKAKTIFVDVCGCWPLRHLSVKPNSITICPIAENVTDDQNMNHVYGSCYDRVLDVTQNLDQIVESCASLCPKNCQYESYSFSELKRFTDKGPYTDNPATFIWLRDGKFVYPRFEESQLFTTDYLIAQVGGSLGLWLGGSIIAILHIPVFFIAMLIDRCKSSRKNPSTKLAPVNPQISVLPTY